ncbi:MAG: Fe-Mn family superoxide dismutase [Myxococcaceae bacterium]
MNRREALTTLAGAMVLGTADAGAPAPTPSGGVAHAGKHEPKPLPFDPAKLNGLSAKLLTSHHENNYGGAVKNLNKVEQQLGGLTKDSPGFLIAGLKERELTFANSVILHEAYFGNLGGDGKASGAIEKALAQSYGSLGAWEEHFRALGGGLGGGSGWAIVDFNFHTGDVRTYWSGGHSQSLSYGAPLLVMDMYEHSYALDFGAAAAKYIDAFFSNLKWDEVNKRLDRALKAHAALKA